MASHRDYEGEYFGFVFQTDDMFASQGYMTSALKVDQLVNGDFKPFWHPLHHVLPDRVDPGIDEQGCCFLLRHNVSKIWTPGEREDFSHPVIKTLFGKELSWDYALDGNEQWGEYRSLDKGYERLLQFHGIQVEYLGRLGPLT
jgi:hypothetical protein